MTFFGRQLMIDLTQSSLLDPVPLLLFLLQQIFFRLGLFSFGCLRFLQREAKCSLKDSFFIVVCVIEDVVCLGWGSKDEG